jgi:hypothetical protein
MDVNDLADRLEQFYTGTHIEKAAEMLRQQKAEIEALKMDIHSLTYGERIAKYFNKPVAWRNLCVGNIGEDSEWIYNEIGQGEPLYTHPAKTLTDEEMIGIYEKDWSGIKCGLGRAVEQAILRKAQEK